VEAAAQYHLALRGASGMLADHQARELSSAAAAVFLDAASRATSSEAFVPDYLMSITPLMMATGLEGDSLAESALLLYESLSWLMVNGNLTDAETAAIAHDTLTANPDEATGEGEHTRAIRPSSRCSRPDSPRTASSSAPPPPSRVRTMACQRLRVLDNRDSRTASTVGDRRDGALWPWHSPQTRRRGVSAGVERDSGRRSIAVHRKRKAGSVSTHFARDT
jgi:hypothetical protein